ncbi:MAG: nucleotidyltransferase family protein [Anaerolineales bacterium]|nr:nucleotidyltransferase family protein [Anaerolineales bacterium]
MSDKMRNRVDIHKRIQKMQGELKSLGVKSLSLFGSASRGEASRKSDLDFLIDFEGPYTFDRYMDIKMLLEDLFDCDVDLVTPDAVRPEMKDNVEKDLYRVA